MVLEGKKHNIINISKNKYRAKYESYISINLFHYVLFIMDSSTLPTFHIFLMSHGCQSLCP